MITIFKNEDEIIVIQQNEDVIVLDDDDALKLAYKLMSLAKGQGPSEVYEIEETE